MTLAELEELHNISPLTNLGSILKRGILSHEKAQRYAHGSVAMSEIQDIRSKVVLPNKKKLHSYANLYINARNTTMFKRKDLHRQLCVVRVDKRILEDSSVVVSDQNACSSYVRFYASVDGLKRIDRDTVFSQYWLHEGDFIATCRHRAAMCAEVLVPDCVRPTFINGIYVSCPESEAEVSASFPGLNVAVNRYMFFR
jgi:hypothetical protein